MKGQGCRKTCNRLYDNKYSLCTNKIAQYVEDNECRICFPCHFCKLHINIQNLKWHGMLICRQWTLVLLKKKKKVVLH